MIDCISGGRLIAGMVVGGGPEYYSFSMNPAHARERFAEAHDLIIRAWTEPGPFEFIGKHYKLRYVNSWPRPVQKPHPEIWIPGVGSLETLEFVAKHRYAYMGIPYFHISVFERMFTMMREACRSEGYEADPCSSAGSCRSSWPRPMPRPAAATRSTSGTSCADCCPGINISPPGYTSVRSVENIMKGWARSPSTSRRGKRWSRASTPSWVRPRRSPSYWPREHRTARSGQPARPVPAGNAAGRRHPSQPRSVRHRGHPKVQRVRRGDPATRNSGENEAILEGDERA